MMRAWALFGRMLYFLSWPLLFVGLRFGRPRTRVVIEAEGRILLVAGWLSGGSWHLPGGGLHRREEPARGAVREVAEETGIILQPKQLASLGESWVNQNGLRFKRLAYGCRLPKALDPTRQRLELVGAKWFKLAEIAARTDVSQDTKTLVSDWLASG